MKLKILSEEFYNKYADCKEILKKKDRPYVCLTVELDGQLFAILKREEDKIHYGLSKYVKQYKRAMKHRDNPRSKNMLEYSSLKYFEEYL